MNQLPTLYSKDTSGKLRVWWITVDGPQYRTNSGLVDGAITVSGWVVAEGKNTGKKNQTTPEKQAEKEAKAEYTKKMKEGYSLSMEDTGAKYFEPMLAKKYGDVPIDSVKLLSGAYSAQPKLDGVRCIFQDGKMKSRNGRDIVSAPHISEFLSGMSLSGIVLDGELYNHSMKDDFNKIVSLVKKQKPNEEELAESKALVEYHIYDIYVEENPSLGFLSRSRQLYNLFDESKEGPIKLVPTYFVFNREEIGTLMAEFLGSGYEGLMLRSDGPYENKRSQHLQKFKEFQDEEFEVVDIQAGVGNWAGKAKRIVLRKLDSYTTFEAGLRGDFAFAEKLLKEKDNYIGGKATGRYQNLTPDGVPRFCVVTKFWPDGEKV